MSKGYTLLDLKHIYSRVVQEHMSCTFFDVLRFDTGSQRPRSIILFSSLLVAQYNLLLQMSIGKPRIMISKFYVTPTTPCDNMSSVVTPFKRVGK